MQRKNITIIAIFFVLIFQSCGNNNAPNTEIIKPDIYGNWLLESLLNYTDSTKSIIGHKQFFCSEIIIKKHSDSVTIVNGDYEYWNTKSDSISETEICLHHLSHMPHSNLYLTPENKLMYYDSAAKKTFYFIKAVNNPIVKANLQLPAMKYEINKRLFEHNFIDLETKKKISFSALNEVIGDKEYKTYQTFINDETADKSEGNIMEFSNPKTKKNKITLWLFKQDTLKIYTSINTECKECKPFYERGVIWKTLVKQ
jgi:hypothetical protein